MLQAFIGADITFAMKPYFRGTFCSQDVREGLLVSFIRHILSVSQVHHHNCIKCTAWLSAVLVLEFNVTYHNTDAVLIAECQSTEISAYHQIIHLSHPCLINQLTPQVYCV